jgi:hypothetical protein
VAISTHSTLAVNGHRMEIAWILQGDGSNFHPPVIDSDVEYWSPYIFQTKIKINRKFHVATEIGSTFLEHIFKQETIKNRMISPFCVQFSTKN